MHRLLDLLSHLQISDKKYVRHFFFGILTVFFGVFIYHTLVYAATYTFTQSSWSGGADTVTVAVHPTNVTNWTKYDSLTNTVAGSTVTLSSTSYAFTDDGATSTSPTLATASGGDFDNGSNSSTAVSGSGTAASVGLALSGGATGGTITTSGLDKIHSFTSSGSFVLASDVDVQYLVVAGGAGGGNPGGGGGAGGMRTGTLTGVTAATYPVTVGGGGAIASNGSNSVFSTITSTGGGAGGNGFVGGGTSGGSGGGGAGGYSAGGIATPAGQGNNGGAANGGWGEGKGAGGGGAGAVGQPASVPPNGGAGLASTISGSSVMYAGGGAGDAYGGVGGSGGGGGVGVAGTANTGGGGGSGAAGGSGIVILRYTQAYLTSGTFTSAVIDLGGSSALSTLDYTKTTPANTTVTVDIRAGNTATPDGTWTEWTTGVASGGSISALGSNRYVQYRANLATTDNTVTPTLDSATINFSQYAATGSLTSSVYDSGDSQNLIARVTWVETATTSADTVRFQVRSSANGSTWSEWCGYADCSGTSYFTDATGNGQDVANNHPLRSDTNDRYFQYKAVFASDGGATPSLSSVSIRYVINAPPDFDATYGTNGVTVSQDSTSSNATWGKVSIAYKVRDIDTNSGTTNPGYITPSFEYSTDGGSNWASIPSGDLEAADVTNKIVDQSIYNVYTATWNATSTTNTYSATAKIRVTANDNEAANNTVQAVSAAFALDTRVPVQFAILDASTGASTGTITLSITDDSQSQYRLCNDSTFPTTDAEGNSCAWSTLGANIASSTITWTPRLDASNNEPVYLETRDALSNKATRTIVAPAKPANFDIKDISNTSIEVYKEFLSWSVFTATTSSAFSSYKIYGSTDGSSYSLLSTITNSATNYYIDTITTATTSLHYYKAVTVTTQGNISAYTTALSDIPNGQGGSDVTAPTISSASIVVPSSDLRNTSALVTFTSDELAKGTLQYRANGAVSWTTVASASYVLAHSIYAQGLSANTLYNTQVKAEDVAGNVSAYVAGPDFTTAGGPVITDTSETNLTDNSVTITWNTSTSSDSYVYYSTNQDLTSATTQGSATQVECIAAVCQHKVNLSSLTESTTYYYYVKSTDSSSNSSTDTNSGSYYSFHTTKDVTPPVISGIATPVTSATAAVIVWQTDKAASSQVAWGTVSGSLTRTTVLDSTKSIYHIVTLSSETNDTSSSGQALTASTNYYYTVTSVDASGNSATSAEQTFRSPAVGQTRIITATTGSGDTVTAAATPPTISSVTSENISAFGADIRVTTSKSATTFVSYGPTTAYGSIEGDDAFAVSKVVKLRRLQEGTTYHYRVKVTDENGNTVTGSDQTFKTIFASEYLNNLTTLEKATDLQNRIEELIQSALPSLAPPFITKPIIDSVTEDSATITWKTNIKALGSLRYATDAVYKEKKEYVTEIAEGQEGSVEHMIALSSLEPNTLYHLQVRSYVFPQVVGTSSDMTFSTKAAPITVNIVSVKNNGFTVVWQTTEPTTSHIEYRDLKTGVNNIITDDVKKTYHDVQIQNLPAGVSYAVSVSGVNENGNRIETGEPLRVTTSVDVTPPVITNFKVDNALVPGRTGFIQTVVSWQTDKPANSTVFYQEGASVSASTTREFSNKVEALDTYTTGHIMILANLKSGTVYSIKIVSVDQSGNTKTFGPTSIITPQQTQSVLDIIVKNFEDTFKFLGTKQ